MGPKQAVKDDKRTHVEEPSAGNRDCTVIFKHEVGPISFLPIFSNIKTNRATDRVLKTWKILKLKSKYKPVKFGKKKKNLIMFECLSCITEFPSSLNKSKFRVVDEERNGSPEKIWFRLEISIENGYVVAVLHVAAFHSLFESPCFVTVSVVSYFILDVYTFAGPSLAF